MSQVNPIDKKDSISQHNQIVKINNQLIDAAVKEVALASLNEMAERSEGRIVNDNLINDLKINQERQSQIKKLSNEEKKDEEHIDRIVQVPLQNISNFSN
jgi:hypothetical protein